MRLSKQDFIDHVVAKRARPFGGIEQAKHELSAKLAAEVDEYLKHNEITVIPTGVSLEYRTGGDLLSCSKPFNSEIQHQDKKKRIKEQQALLLKYEQKFGCGCWAKLADVVGRKFIVPSQLRRVVKGHGEITKSWPRVKSAVEMELGERS